MDWRAREYSSGLIPLAPRFLTELKSVRAIDGRRHHKRYVTAGTHRSGIVLRALGIDKIDLRARQNRRRPFCSDKPDFWPWENQRVMCEKGKQGEVAHAHGSALC